MTQSPYDHTADELIGVPIPPTRLTLPGEPLTLLRLETTKVTTTFRVATRTNVCRNRFLLIVSTQTYIRTLEVKPQL